MNKILINLILFLNFLITLEEKENKNKQDSNNKDKNKTNKSKKLKIFLLQLGVIIIIIILIYFLIKLCVCICKKKLAFKKLLEEFSKNKLISEKTIDQIKYIYGFEYVISFLKEIIFISCKFNNKIKEIRNCGNCSICLNGFNLDDKIFITSCNHVYHNKCMTDYLKLIVKDINPNENNIENFHNYFQCPNCKEYLFKNRLFLQNERKVENDIEDNNNEFKPNELDKRNVFIISKKSRNNIKNIISTEGSSKRNISALARNVKNKKKIKHVYKKGHENGVINNNINKKQIHNTNIIEGENNYKSDMKLKENIEFQNKENIIDKPDSISGNNNRIEIQSNSKNISIKENGDIE